MMNFIFWRCNRVLCLVFLSSVFGGKLAALEPGPPVYELRLSYLEFTFLNKAANDGVGKYGGTADFTVRIERSEKEPITLIRTTNTRLLDVWQLWVVEKTAELVNTADLDNLNPSTKAELQVARSAKRRIEDAKASPIWDEIQLTGRIKDKDGTLVCEGEHGSLVIDGPLLGMARNLVQREVIAKGSMKSPGHIELIQLLERRERMLELFVMSQCPFGTQAEEAIIRALRQWPETSGPRPTLEVRYILYRKVADTKTIFSSLHGEPEITEDLVQIVIRDLYPAYFHDYLLRRASDQASWEKLATDIGLNQEAITDISRRIVVDREKMLETEYEYASKRYSIVDGSPTYVWESRVVTDLREVPALAHMPLSGDSCGDQH